MASAAENLKDGVSQTAASFSPEAVKEQFGIANSESDAKTGPASPVATFLGGRNLVPTGYKPMSLIPTITTGRLDSGKVAYRFEC